MSSKLQTYINASQIRAARALINWSQEQLAIKSGLSVATVRKLELGYITPRSNTIDQIRKAFEEVGLEFMEPSGVRQRPEEIMIFQGSEGICNFFDDVYQTASQKGGELVMVYASEDPFCEAMGEYDSLYMQRMQSIKEKISVKCILTENTENLCSAGYTAYRTISKQYIDSVPFYIYHNKYAIILFNADPSPKIIVIQSQLIADAYRCQFYSMWEKATPLNDETDYIKKPQTSMKNRYR